MTHHRTTGPGRPAATRRGARPGTALVLIAGGMTLLMASAVWVVDLAAGLQSRTAQQAASDAAALAGAMELIPPYTAAKGDAAKAAAVNYAQLNGYTITTADVTIFDYAPSGGKAITVHSATPQTTFFANFFGITSMDVGTYSTVALGGVTEMPSGTIPFGVPAEKVFYNGQWTFKVLKSANPDVYTDPLPKEPDPSISIQLKVRSGGQNGGNFLALSLDGRGAQEYKDDIMNGCTTDVKIGDLVDTQTGNMVGPTGQGIETRKGDVVTVPLVDKVEWDANRGRSTIHVIGFLNVLIQDGAQNGEVVGVHAGGAVSAQGQIGSTGSPGVYAPVLIETP